MSSMTDNRPLPASARRVLMTVPAAVLLLIAANAIVIVSPGESGVVVSWGQVQPKTLGEGLHFVTPVRDRVEHVDVTIKKMSIDADATSRDLQSVLTKVAVNFSVDPARANIVFQRFRKQHDDRFVGPAIQESVKASTARFPAEELITKRSEVKKAILGELESRLEPQHFKVVNVSIENFQFDRQFQAAIERKQVAAQKILEERNILESRRVQAEQVVAAAKGEAEARLTRARAEAESLKIINEQLTDKTLRKILLDRWKGEVPLSVGADRGSFLDLATASKIARK